MATQQEEFSGEWPGFHGGQYRAEVPLVAGSHNNGLSGWRFMCVYCWSKDEGLQTYSPCHKVGLLEEVTWKSLPESAMNIANVEL